MPVLPIDVTNLTRVKDFLQITGDTQYDTFLTNAIKSVSGRFERYMARGITQAARAEYFNVDPGQNQYSMMGWPVASITDVRFDWARVFGTDTILTSDLYSARGEEGILFLDRYWPYAGNKVLLVNYVGGMATDTTNFIASFPELAEAGDMQVAFMHRRRNNIGTAGVSELGASVSFDSFDLIPEVKDRLDRFRRHHFAG